MTVKMRTMDNARGKSDRKRYVTKMTTIIEHNNTEEHTKNNREKCWAMSENLVQPVPF